MRYAVPLVVCEGEDNEEVRRSIEKQTHVLRKFAVQVPGRSMPFAWPDCEPSFLQRGGKTVAWPSSMDIAVLAWETQETRLVLEMKMDDL